MKIVLDTNVVLDWLWFDDRATRWLTERSTKLILLRHPLSVDELQRVVRYEKLNIDPLRQATIVERYLAETQEIAMSAPMSRGDLRLPPSFPHCRDQDDDVFLAMTFHAQADALVTKDKQLLRLRKRAVRFGVHIKALADLQSINEKS